MCREIDVSGLKMCLLQLRIEIFITCLLRNIFCQDFNSSVESMDLSHGDGLVLVSVDGGWNVCWLRWLNWEWQCWEYTLSYK